MWERGSGSNLKDREHIEPGAAHVLYLGAARFHMGVRRVSFSLDSKLLNEFERLRSRLGIKERSAAIQQALREFISAKTWELGESGLAIIALIYDREQAQLEITQIQHGFRECIRSELHQHLDPKRCLELILVQGTKSQLESLAQKLSCAPGLHQLKLIQIG